MGLDMFLYIQRSCSYNDAKTTIMGVPTQLQKIAELSGYKEAKVPLVITQRYQIAYWRKAYSIHNYFVDTAAFGDASATLNYVVIDPGILQQLKDDCEKILAEDRDTHEYASEYLPDDDEKYDADYYEEIEYTLKILKELLPYYEECVDEDNKAGVNYYTDILYSASW